MVKLCCFVIYQKTLVAKKGLDAGKIVRELGKIYRKVAVADSRFLQQLAEKKLME